MKMKLVSKPSCFGDMLSFCDCTWTHSYCPFMEKCKKKVEIAEEEYRHRHRIP